MKLSEQVLNFELKEKKRYFETWKNENLLNFIEIDHIKKKRISSTLFKNGEHLGLEWFDVSLWRNKRLEEKVPKRMPMDDLWREQVSLLVLTGSLVACSICGQEGHIDVADAAITLSRSNSSTSMEGPPLWFRLFFLC